MMKYIKSYKQINERIVGNDFFINSKYNIKELPIKKFSATHRTLYMNYNSNVSSADDLLIYVIKGYPYRKDFNITPSYDYIFKVGGVLDLFEINEKILKY